MAQLRGEQRGAQPAFALGPRQDDVAEVSLERVERRLAGLRGRLQAGQQRGHGRVGRGVVAALAERVVDELGDAGDLADRGLGVEPRRGPVGQPDERDPGRVDHGGQALEPAGDRGQPDRQRGELACEQREEPTAHQVDPFERVPGVLPQLGLAEPDPVELEQHEVAVDPLVAGQVRIREFVQLGDPAVDERQPVASTGLGQVGPLGIVSVHADRGRRQRVQSEELDEEVVDPRAEASPERGHGPQSRPGRRRRPDSRRGSPRPARHRGRSG